MFKVGQEVKVTDQRPPAIGVVEKISTWHEVSGGLGSNGVCYRICCPDWQGTARWIGACFVKAIDRPKLG